MDITLFSTISTNYRVPFEVLVSTLLLAKRPSTAVEWHLCTDDANGGWDEWNAEMTRRHGNRNVTFVMHRLQEGTGQCLPVRGRAKPIMYARLFIPKILPLAGRILYLDADMIVLRPIEDLWETDFESHACACCQDLAIPTVSSPMAIPDHQELNLDPGAPYFNAGVLLIDVRRWKEQSVTERALEYLAVHQEKVNLFDQEALNAALDFDWRRLSFRWNLIASVAGRSFLDIQPLVRDDYMASLKDPCIVHYAGSLKPWLNPFLMGKWYEFYRAALRQSLPQFRPHHGLKHLARAVYDALLRRWVYPWERKLWAERKGF